MPDATNASFQTFAVESSPDRRAASTTCTANWLSNRNPRALTRFATRAFLSASASCLNFSKSHRRSRSFRINLFTSSFFAWTASTALWLEESSTTVSISFAAANLRWPVITHLPFKMSNLTSFLLT